MSKKAPIQETSIIINFGEKQTLFQRDMLKINTLIQLGLNLNCTLSSMKLVAITSESIISIIIITSRSRRRKSAVGSTLWSCGKKSQIIISILKGEEHRF